MFAIGDVVKLKSGGPAMTVWGRRDSGLTEVEWFVGTELKRDAFHLNELLDMAEIAKVEAEFRKNRLAVEREIWDAYKGISCTNSLPATIIAGEGWAEAAFDASVIEQKRNLDTLMFHQNVAHKNSARYGLGYNPFGGFK